MAIPIKETPILRGKDAVRFRKNMKNLKKVSPATRRRVKDNYEKIKKIIK